MPPVKVWLGGEGSCELGGRADGTDRIGTLEALLAKLEASGWVVAGATRWKHIRKYKAGASLREGISHADLANARGLILQAYEAGCEVVAFARDRDVDEDRASAVEKGIELSGDLPVRVIGGLACPCLEGWVLALKGGRDTDTMSRRKAKADLAAHGVTLGDPEAYVEVVERAALDDLPPRSASLAEWLDTATTVLALAIRGG